MGVLTLSLIICYISFGVIYSHDPYINLNLDPGIYKKNIGDVLISTETLKIEIDHSYKTLLNITKAIDIAVEKYNSYCMKSDLLLDVDILVCVYFKMKHYEMSRELNKTILALIPHGKNINYSNDIENNIVLRLPATSEEDNIAVLTLDFLIEVPMNFSYFNSKLHSALNVYQHLTNYYKEIQFEATNRNKENIDIAITSMKSKLKVLN